MKLDLSVCDSDLFHENIVDISPAFLGVNMYCSWLASSLKDIALFSMLDAEMHSQEFLDECKEQAQETILDVINVYNYFRPLFNQCELGFAKACGRAIVLFDVFGTSYHHAVFNLTEAWLFRMMRDSGIENQDWVYEFEVQDIVFDIRRIAYTRPSDDVGELIDYDDRALWYKLEYDLRSEVLRVEDDVATIKEYEYFDEKGLKQKSIILRGVPEDGLRSGRYKPPICEKCKQKMRTVSSPKTVRKIKCDVCNIVKTVART